MTDPKVVCRCGRRKLYYAVTCDQCPPLKGTTMKRASYREAVKWIADNDESGIPDQPVETVAEYTTTSLIADLFGVTTERVATDVLRARAKHT